VKNDFLFLINPFFSTMCITIVEHSCFKNNIKKNGLDLKKFHFSLKKIEKI
jgi:hypothetical protein